LLGIKKKTALAKAVFKQLQIVGRGGVKSVKPILKVAHNDYSQS
jgi:hypothetical protein